MEIIPALDLIGGACVRLRQGDYEQKTVYDADPVAVARSFVEAGARRLHVVDLDAARGSGDNRRVIAEVCRAVAAVGAAIEVGGGVRSREDVAALVDAGVRWVAVGTTLVRDPDEVARWAGFYPDTILASIDARDGEVRVSGWQDDSGISAVDLARTAVTIGCAAIEFTEISRDGTLAGPDIPATVALARAVAIPVILSGGVSRVEDVVEAHREGGGVIAGCIVGRALYEGRFDLARAIREVQR